MEDYIFIVGKEPKENLEDILNDCNLDVLKKIFENIGEKKKGIKTKKEYVSSLIKIIPEKFRYFLENDDVYIDIFRMFNCNNKENYSNNYLIANGYLFHYHFEDRECINVIPRELLDIFDEVFDDKKRDEYLFNIICETISNYLLVNGFIPKEELKKMLFEEKELNMTEEKYEKALKEVKVGESNGYFSMIPSELVDLYKTEKNNYSYKKINISTLFSYCKKYNKLIDDVLLLLGIESREKNPMMVIKVVLDLTVAYSMAYDAPETLKKELKLDDDTYEELKELIYSNINSLRFWVINGRTYDEFKIELFLKNGVLDKKPDDNTILSCLKRIPDDGLKLIKDYFEVESDKLSDLENIIIEDLNEFIEQYSLGYLENILFCDGQEYVDEIDVDFLFAGLIYLYNDNNKVKVLLTKELKKILENILDNSFEQDEVVNCFNRYITINGVIGINKMLELLNDVHHLDVSKDEIINLAQRFGVNVIDNKYLAFFSDMTLEDAQELMHMKNIFGEYRHIDIYENDVEHEFLEKLEYFVRNLEDEDKNFICSTVSMLVFNGSYKKGTLKDILKEVGLSKYVDDLDKIVSEYKNRVGIWAINGFTLNNRQVTKTKIGRNEPCPCGSGKKYKKCCGR